MEYNADRAWYYDFNEDRWYYSYKDYDFIYVRACLAF